MKLNYEEINYNGNKIGDVLEILNVSNANGFDLSNISEWEEFICSIDKKKIETRELFNTSGEKIGFANIYK